MFAASVAEVGDDQAVAVVPPIGSDVLDRKVEPGIDHCLKQCSRSAAALVGTDKDKNLHPLRELK
jgi:hypothetical protein